MPARLQNRPELDPHLGLAWEAFGLLSRSRVSNGMGGVSGILISEILTYLQWVGIRDQDTQLRLLTQVCALDGAYLKHHHEAQEKARKKK